MTWTEQKSKGTPFKVQSVAIANTLYIDLIHQWPGEEEGDLPTELLQHSAVCRAFPGLHGSVNNLKRSDHLNHTLIFPSFSRRQL